MLEDHLRAVARFQRHLRRVLNRGQPIADEAVAETIILPCERLPALDVGGLGAGGTSPFWLRSLLFFRLAASSFACASACLGCSSVPPTLRDKA